MKEGVIGKEVMSESQSQWRLVEFPVSAMVRISSCEVLPQVQWDLEKDAWIR